MKKREKPYRVTLARAPHDRQATLGSRSWRVNVNGRQVGSVAPLYVGWSHDTDGWYFVVSDDELGIPLRNTCGERDVPEEDVKKSAVEYVKKCLAERGSR